MSPRAAKRPTLYGTAMIESSVLEAVPNPAPKRDYLISCVAPEFTCLCPRSGFPDFATIHLRYVPEASIVELKSLKLYINKYRNEHVFHEAAINQICDDLVACVAPRWIEVVGDFTVRGNIRTVITVVQAADGYVLPSAIQSIVTATSPSEPTA
ncbi:MAG: NADPH-dependent 7-cyano-7-deazaguanine reductase QueF [Chloroflexota bacterium]|nr:MAG: NADPH-dependent 7-cyano-7-deazaguanine reductase QueF [Chloroflexota bacterium]